MTEPSDLINREIPGNVLPIVNWFADTIDEYVNFGSVIFQWDAIPKTKGEENIPPTMLFRHYLDLIDSIATLVRTGTGDTPKILIRAALEVMLYIEYLFENDTYRRSMAYVVMDTLDQIKTVSRLNSDTDEGRVLQKVFLEEKLLPVTTIGDPKELNEFLAAKKRLLAMPQFESANVELKKLKASGIKNPKWYQCYNGPNSIFDLAKYLKQQTLYELLYRKWSGAVHGSDIYLGKLSSVASGGQINIVQIRYIKDLQEIVNYSLILSSKILGPYVLNRVPEKYDEFLNWYCAIRPTVSKITTQTHFKVI